MTSKDALIVGAGEVGYRKITALLACSPRCVAVVDPHLSAATVNQLESLGPVVCHTRAFEAQDIVGKSLVFAATANRDINALVATLCAEQRILCNIADAPEASDFFVPAHFTQGNLCIALSTGGSSPALSRHLRKELEAWLGNRYTGLIVVLGRLRPILLDLGLPTSENTRLFRQLVASPLSEFLEKGDADAAVDLLTQYLPASLHPHMREILHGF